jgi:DUF4097 and DUF4098 domain-containing protein YvlB
MTRLAFSAWHLAALAAFLLPAAASAQRNDDEWLDDCANREERGDRVAFCDVRVERLRAGSGVLRVDAGQNGGVIIRGEDRSDVEVHARIQTWARSRAAARALADNVELQLASGSIGARDMETDRGESWSVTFVVLVPRRANLELQAHNGPLSVENVSGAIEAETVNGPLSLRGVSGDVTAHTQNGPLSVELTGTRWSGAGLDAETQNGPVNLSIPEGYSAALETGTVNGPFNTDVPLTVTQLGRVNRRITTQLGSGGPSVRVVTTNGPVNIRRR